SVGSRLGVVVAGPDVKRVMRRVDGGGIPDRAPRRGIQLRAAGILADGLGLVRNDVGLPEFLTGVGIQGHHAAAEGAAGVARQDSGGLLARGNWNIESSPIQGGSAS